MKALLVIAVLLQSTAIAVSKDVVLQSSFGQMLMVGFFGTDVSSRGFQEILRNLEAGRIGGVLFLGRNIESRTKLNAMVKGIRSCRCKYIPLIAIDEEGGKIQRLGTKLYEEHLPAAQDVAKLNDDERRRVFEKLANKLISYGFNMNLAPVVDLNRNQKSRIIAGLGRSYSGDPDIVTKIAVEFIEAHRALGIITSAKHFPGHGSAAEDSHVELINVTKTWSELELVPYRELIGRNLADTIMVGHIYSDLWSGTASLLGATAINRILRKDLAFDGVVISDDVYMGAVRSGKRSALKAALDSLAAGADIVILSRLEDLNEDVGYTLYRELEKEINERRIGLDKIEKSLLRISALKSILRKKPLEK